MSRYRSDEQTGVFDDAPEGCGVYILKDGRGRAVYVGKSLTIRKRLADHRRQADSGDEREAMIMGDAARREYILTANELEALLLENSLIKRFKPRHNILLRDDKTYPYLRIDPREKYPRMTVVRRPPHDRALYFGPYTSVRAMRRTVHFLERLFPLRHCEDEKFRGRQRPCLMFEIGRCLGPCAGRISDAAYAEAVRETVLFLKGRHAGLRARLERKMREASVTEQFEEAARLRDRLEEMRQFFERQSIHPRSVRNADVLGLARSPGGWLVYLIFVRHGAVVGGKPLRLVAPGEAAEGEVLQAFIERHYAGAAEIPARIILPVEPAERALLEEFLDHAAGRSVRMTVPTRGEGLELLLMARRNALSQQEKIGAAERRGKAADPWSGSGLVPGPSPQRIEVYDASSTGGSQPVVGMVLWEEGAFRRGEYRRFRVKVALAADDYGMIREAIGRRMKRVKEGEFPAPDLILVDGGAGHVSTVREELERSGFGAIRLLGISKGERRREGDRLHLADGRSPDLPPGHPLVRFLGTLRDEVHRWAVGYHRQLRAETVRSSVLDEIPGLGPRRKAILVNYFGHPRAVANANIDDLAAVPGIPAAVARAIRRHFHPV